MPVITIETKNGPVTAIVCSHRRGQYKLCRFCSNRLYTRLCDFVVARKKTCDAPMCDACATSVGPDLDYCPTHKKQPAPPQQNLFGDSQ